MQLTCQQVADAVGGNVSGDPALSIDGLEELALARPGQLTFIGDAPHAKQWATCRASAALVKIDLIDSLEPGDGRALIAVDDVDLAMAVLLERFAPPVPQVPVGVHPTAVIDPSAELGNDVAIGPLVVVGARATIGDGAQLHSHAQVFDDCAIGAGCVLWQGVVVRERCTVGDGSVLHAGVVIGTDGFGYRAAPDGKGIVKVPQIGHVEIGRGCEIGSNTCVDRGKFSATVVGDGTKLDNLVQIGHNVRIGRCTLIAGQTAVGGSTIIGDGVQIGGGCDVSDHQRIGDGATLAGGSQLMNDIPAGETWAGSPAQEYRKAVKEYAAVRKLPEVMKTVRKHLRGAE